MFEKCPERKAGIGNATIDEYVRNGFKQQALSLDGRMLDEGISPTDTTFVHLLKRLLPAILRQCGNFGRSSCMHVSP